jgi:hypothetical protein
MFLVFVAARGRLPAYQDVLWGGGGKGGGTVEPEKPKTPLDSKGDGFDQGDAMKLVGALLPYPFGVPFDLMTGDA